jgi:hypothetical protein
VARREAKNGSRGQKGLDGPSTIQLIPTTIALGKKQDEIYERQKGRGRGKKVGFSKLLPSPGIVNFMQSST